LFLFFGSTQLKRFSPLRDIVLKSGYAIVSRLHIKQLERP